MNEKNGFKSDNNSNNDSIKITVENKYTKYRERLMVFPENTLQEIIDVCKTDIHLDRFSNGFCVEYRDKEESDMKTTVEALGLSNDDELIIIPIIHWIA